MGSKLIQRAAKYQSVFNSRVARRVFLILVMAALAPFAVLAGLTATQMQRENARVEQRQLHSTAKSVGNTFFDMLEDADATLRYLAQIDPELRDRSFHEAPKHWFTVYSVINSSGKAVRTDANLPAVPAAMLPRLARGESVIFTAEGYSSGPLYMAVPPTVATAAGFGLIGAIDLRAFEDLGGDESAMCLLTESNLPLLCDPSVPERIATASAPLISREAFQSVHWETAETRWHGGIWSVYTERRFGIRALKLLIAFPDAMLVNQQSQLYRNIPPVIAITLLLVVFVSVRLIRNLLRPLDRLTSATKSLARGNFATRVRVRTGDEFEELAGSFNAMAVNLNHQFQMLETVAEVDRIVLVAKGVSEIVDALLARLPRVAACDVMAVVLLDGARIKEARCQGVDGSEDDEPVIRAKHLDTAVMEMLSGCEQHLVVNDSSGFTFLQHVFADGVESVVCVPVRQQQEITALICLGYRDAAAATDAAIQSARALADHAALVFSSAQWEERLYHQAHYDALTDLPNRQLFASRLDDAIASAGRHGHHVALLFIDVDHFKTLNDSLGHSAGDEYLVGVAKEMRNCVGEEGTLVRLGGDEFTVVLPAIDDAQRVLEVSQTLAERIRASFLKPITVNGQNVALTASIGIAVYPTDAENRLDLVRFADQAMYHAKENGRNNWAYYSEEINNSALERLELAAALSGALERGELFLTLQPKVDSKTRRLRGAEVLLRWRHPQWGAVSPLRFIPIAEQTGLIVPIGIWVIEQACRYIVRRNNEGLEPFALSINVSSVQLRHADFLDVVVALLQRYQVEPKLFELEVTESLCVGDVKAASRLLSGIRASGMRVAIDDFGTGFSSMNYLRHFSVDTIKIDQSFMRGVPDDPFNMAITRAVSSMAHGMGLSVVAEGVETEVQLEHVRNLGCEETQGYLIAKPMPLDEFDAWLVGHEQSVVQTESDEEAQTTITELAAARSARR